MDFFQKVTDFAKVKIQEQKERTDKQRALDNLSKDQLLELAAKHGVSVSKADAKEDMIASLSACKELTVKDIMKKVIKKPKTKEVVSKSIKRKVKEEDVEVEQEIIRTEKIKTTVKRRSTELEFDEIVSKTINKFQPTTKMKEGVKEKQIEGELVQSLRGHIPEEKVDYQQRGKGGRMDIVVNNNIVIELKIIKGETDLRNLMGQLKIYSKEYKKLYVWMYDFNGIIKPQRLNDFKNDLDEWKIKNIEVIKRP